MHVLNCPLAGNSSEVSVSEKVTQGKNPWSGVGIDHGIITSQFKYVFQLAVRIS